MNLKQALALGFELTSFILVSYVVAEPLAEAMGWDSNLTLSSLFALSLAIWTLHAFLATKEMDK